MKGTKNGQSIKNLLAQSLVEFALVLPFLLVLIISTIELGGHRSNSPSRVRLINVIDVIATTSA